MGHQSQKYQDGNSNEKATQSPFGLEDELTMLSHLSLFQGTGSAGLKNITPERQEGLRGELIPGLVPTGLRNAPFQLEALLFETGMGVEEANNDAHHDEEHDDHLHGLPGVDLTLEKGATGVSDNDLPTQGGTFDLAKTFFLHSNLNATHTIYLDFDGHTTTDSAWTTYNGGNDIVTSAYDFDGNTSNFSTSELSRIQYIWQRVAEDFSPFNVNVTTQDPGVAALSKSGSGDAQWGTRVVIGAGDWFGAAGGVAYVSSFNASIDRPAFVFENQLGNGNEKYTAEAISHEVGHALGLNHDGQDSTEYYAGHGSGTTGWASILGAGYYKNLTQWSKGEYSGATNTQDDLAIITGNNGFSYRADDHGNTFESATNLTSNVTALSAAGIIERNTDFDVFSFYTGAGQVSLNVNTAPRGANLDILANLYNASGSLVASSNPLDALNASFTLALAAGQYFVEVTGTGKGDPLNGGYSDYGSLGQYTLNGTIVNGGGDFLEISSLIADQSEGNSGTKLYSFVVNRTGDTTGVTSVEYQLGGVGTNAASANDFANNIFPSGTLQFGANETSKVIEVLVNGDAEVEADEAFRVSLVNPGIDTTLVNTSADGLIRNDDTPPPPVLPNVSIGPATVAHNEGNSGTTAYQFTVSLDQASSDVVTVNFLTNDGTATAASGDYVDNDGVLVFKPGEALSQTITVLANGDTVVESNESFQVQLTGASNAEILTNSVTGTIQNDDVPVTESSANFTISDVTTAEVNGKAIFTISRSGNTDSMASVDFKTVEGTGKRGAKAGSDFIASQNTVIFSAGEIAKTVEIGVIDDANQERDESFYVDLFNASSNAMILDTRGRGTILNDDGGSDSGGGKGRKPKAASLRIVDSILGVSASDTIMGAHTAIEMQRGTKGRDMFILGDEQGSFYSEAGNQDFALISGLNRKRDTIQLHGLAEDYQLVRGAGPRTGMALFHQEGTEQELIAVIRGNKTLSLESSTFQMV